MLAPYLLESGIWAAVLGSGHVEGATQLSSHYRSSLPLRLASVVIEDFSSSTSSGNQAHISTGLRLACSCGPDTRRTFAAHALARVAVQGHLSGTAPGQQRVLQPPDESVAKRQPGFLGGDRGRTRLAHEPTVYQLLVYQLSLQWTRAR